MGYMSRKPTSNEPELQKTDPGMVECKKCGRKVPWYFLDFNRICQSCRPCRDFCGASSDGDWNAE